MRKKDPVHKVQTCSWLGLLVEKYSGTFHPHHAESFIVFRISVLSLSLLLLKDSEFFGIFYCFSNFGTILIIIILFSGRRLESQISKTASHSTTKLHSYIDPYLTMCSARFGVDPDYHSGSRAKSVFSDSPHYLQNLSSDLQLRYL